MNNAQLQQTSAPSLLKLGACLMYEALTIIALSMLGAWLFLMFAGDATHGIKRSMLQLFLWSVVGAYFVWCWSKGGQTLAMQAWRMKLVGQQDELLHLQVAMLRYLLATLSLMLCGLGYLWAVVDSEKLFLHDRLLKTKVITLLKNL